MPPATPARSAPRQQRTRPGRHITRRQRRTSLGRSTSLVRLMARASRTPPMSRVPATYLTFETAAAPVGTVAVAAVAVAAAEPFAAAGGTAAPVGTFAVAAVAVAAAEPFEIGRAHV